MPRYLIFLGITGSVIGLIDATLFFVSQTTAITASALTSSTQQTHYAWGLVVGNGFGNPFIQMLTTLQEFNG